MLKKLLIFLPLIGLSFGGFLLWGRIQANPKGVIPTPYAFPKTNEKIAVDAPLLIVGDRMATRFGLFKENLSLEISTGLSKPLKTGVLASEHYGLHRTLRQLENLDIWPKVLLYTGGSEEFYEDKFLTNQTKTIRENLRRYQDDTWRTVLMLWPPFARALYTPVVRMMLPDQPANEDVREVSEKELQARLELSYQLYEIELNRLVELAREHDAILIFMTSPVNLDIAPKKTCELSEAPEITSELVKIRELIKQQDYKAAYARSKSLSEVTLGNASVYYLHGQVSYRAGLRDEAIAALKKAAAYDCKNWRANEVTNNIMRKVASEQRVTLFDFALLVEGDWNQNTTFFDEVYPQDLYYEKATKALAIVLRRMLKL